MAWYFVDDITGNMELLIRSSEKCDEPEIKALAQQLLEKMKEYRDNNYPKTNKNGEYEEENHNGYCAIDGCIDWSLPNR